MMLIIQAQSIRYLDNKDLIHAQSDLKLRWAKCHTVGFVTVLPVKVLNFRTPKLFAVITLKFKQRVVSIQKCVEKVFTEWQTV